MAMTGISPKNTNIANRQGHARARPRIHMSPENQARHKLMIVMKNGLALAPSKNASKIRA
jgi:hypothetical protein